MRLAAITCVAAAALGVAAAPAGGAAGGAARVSLKDISFKPATVRVAAGRSVTWTWRDPDVLHNIHSSGKPRFKGATTRKAGTYSVRFTRRGTYRYECTIHPGMRGTVVVR